MRRPEYRPLWGASVPTQVETHRRPLSCVSCGLINGAITSPKMAPYGAGRKGILVVGEAPGEVEDKRGKPWQGAAGGVLRRALAELGIDLFLDCVSTNSVNCRPPKNRTPTDYEIACCRKVMVDPALTEHRPRLVLLLGGSAVSSVVGPLHPEALGAAIGRWRGLHIPSTKWGAWLCPTYHSSYIMREQRPEVETIWKQDLRRALARLGDEVPQAEDLRGKVVILRTEAEILSALHAAKAGKRLSFDYETTGLNPRLHKLVCASFCQSASRVYAFLWTGASEAVKQAWRDLLADDAIGKLSHNLSFEYEWSRVHAGVDKIKWAWDSMLAAHVLDNRPGICGLKFQAFTNFGVAGYDASIEPYLRAADTKDPRSPNKLDEFIARFGADEALIYCATDSLMAFRLAERQMRQIGT